MKTTVLFLAMLAMTAFLPPSANQSDEPPTCTDCLFDKLPAGLSHRLTIAPDTVRGQRIRLTGTVFLSDGVTPAAGVLLYAYHTNAAGRYPKHGSEDKRSYAWWHGYLRGWLRTDAKGRYEISTIKPGMYPTRDAPAHIHAIVKAPMQHSAYWISDFVFQGDPQLTDSYWYKLEQREGLVRYGGVALQKGRDGVAEGHRDLVLHAAYDRDSRSSGLVVGEECPAFDPVHVWGPDKGTKTCPMCKYGHRTAGVMAWLSDDDWDNAAQLAVFLEKQMQRRGADRFKAFLIYTNPKKRPLPEVQQQLTAFAKQHGLRELSVLYVPSLTDKQTSYLYRINPNTRNTLLIYNKRRVVDKFVNLSALTQKGSYENLNNLLASINQVAGPLAR
nr:hypothetical protein [uncultured Arsenicibacter sp.]